MPGDLTVEQLAHESGMSVRNIRNHQSRGLLPPPEVRARIGYYGPEHVDRLRLIQEMQAEGFNLEAIKRLLGDDGQTASRLLGVKRVISMPDDGESPEILTRAEGEERFGPIDPKVMSRARKLELMSRSARIATRSRARRSCAPPRTSSAAASRCRARST